MVEVPAGLCDPGEDPAVTLIREAREEMGITPRRILRIGDFLLTPGGCDENVSLHVGEVTAPATGEDGIVGTAGLAAEEEDIRIRVWPAERAVATALAGGFPNSVTSLALLWLASRRDWVRRAWGAA
jgi:ADP-ribose pyrophosphatase